MRRLARRSVLLGAFGLTGCGFEPVYMPSAGDTPGVAQRELAAIDVSLIRTGPVSCCARHCSNAWAGLTRRPRNIP